MEAGSTSSPVHPFYAHDARATAFTTSTAVPGPPDYFMSIAASPKFEKHSFEVGVLGLVCVLTRLTWVGTSTSFPHGRQGGGVVRDTHAWRVACSVCPDLAWTPTRRRIFVRLVKTRISAHLIYPI